MPYLVDFFNPTPTDDGATETGELAISIALCAHDQDMTNFRNLTMIDEGVGLPRMKLV